MVVEAIDDYFEIGVTLGFVSSLLGSKSGAGYSAVGASGKQMKTAYNQTQESIKQQQDFVKALQAQNGLANQSQVFQQQQDLANQYQQIANGQGPNPAQAMLNQATGKNVQQQAALMAGQRGASANAGLIARQAANQGSNAQQQSIGQGATLQAQQQLAALGQIQQQQAMMGNLATQQVGQQQTGLSNLGQQSLQQQSNLYGLQQNANSANAGIAAQNAQAQANLLGNVVGGLGSAAMMIGMGPAAGAAGGAAATSPYSSGSFEQAYAKGLGFAEGGKVGPKSKYGMMCANGGKVPALVSPGEKYLSPQAVQQVKSGANPMQVGETIPGKAKVKGAVNDYSNDTVPKELDEGGIVVPRSVTQSKNPDKKALDFIAAVLKNKLR